MGPTPSPGIHSPLTLYPRGFPGGGNQLKRISLELRAWALGLSGALRRPLGDWETWLRPAIEGTPSTTSADTRKKGHISASPPHGRKRRKRASPQHGTEGKLRRLVMTFPKATQQAGMRVRLRLPKSCTSCCFSQAAQVGRNEETTFAPLKILSSVRMYLTTLQQLDQLPCAAMREDGEGQSLLKSLSFFCWKPTKSS